MVSICINCEDFDDVRDLLGRSSFDRDHVLIVIDYSDEGDCFEVTFTTSLKELTEGS